MLSIHLRRTGASRDPHYRVVVSDRRAARDGAFIEILGHYHPRHRPAKVSLNVERLKFWMARGARPSDTVRSLLRQVEQGRVEVVEEGEGAGEAPPSSEPPGQSPPIEDSDS